MGATPAFLMSKIACLAGRYVLPGNPGDQHWIPQSGGADSAALAIVLTTLFPNVEFKLLFTDTGVDHPGCYDVLEKVEAWTGRKILRLGATRNLYELIADYGGFLPSATARYCTRELKTKPFVDFVSTTRKGDERIYAHVGIRADERTRLALTAPGIETELPFVEMGLVRADIMAVLAETIGVPAFYRSRVRSGCATCFFQRRVETIGLLQEHPLEFVRGMKAEKVPASIAERHEPAAPLWRDTGLGANHLTFPIPSDIDKDDGDVVEMRGRKPRNNETMALFGAGPAETLFVAYELFYRPETGVWGQRFLTYSRELAGLKRQLDGHWANRLLTAEAHHLTQDEIRRELKLVIACIELPKEQCDVNRLQPEEGALYTWSEGESYSQVRHLTSWAMRTLHLAGLKQEREKYERFRERPTTWGFEQLEATEEALRKVTEPAGEVLRIGRYIPSVQDEQDMEFDEKSTPCPMCTLGL